MDKFKTPVQASAVDAPTLWLKGNRKSHGAGTAHVTEVLHGIDLTLAWGEFATLIGPSGSGKSTLLNIIGLLDKPSSGKLFLTGQEAENLPDKALTWLRGDAIGFVFQFHNLLFDLMRNVSQTSGTTFLIVTHYPRLAKRCDRIIELVDGRIASDLPNAATHNLS